MDRIYQQHWITLSKEIRESLAQKLNIPRTGIREIRDDYVVSDGHTNQDLSVITLDVLKEYTGADGKFPELWELTIAKALIPEPKEEEPAKELVGEPVVEVKTVEPIKFTNEEIEARFCQECDSKGMRHLKGCSKFVPIER